MSSKSLKLNGVELSNFSDMELKKLCLRYNIITTSEVHTITKDKMLDEIKLYVTHKVQKYKGRRLSQPNIVNPTKTINGPPQSMEQYTRDRRMSHPITTKEIKVAKENHIAREQINQGQQEIRSMKENPNMKQYDQLGMYLR